MIIRGFVDFKTFLTNYAETSPRYWNTHTIEMDSTGNIEVKEGDSSQREKSKILMIFQANITDLEESLKTDFSLADSMISVSGHLTEDLGIDFAGIIKEEYIPITITALDEVVPLDLKEYRIFRKTSIFQAVFEGSFSEAISKEIFFPISTEEIKAYLDFATQEGEDNQLPDLEKLESIFSCASYIGDEATCKKCIKLMCIGLRMIDDLESLQSTYVKLLGHSHFCSNREIQLTATECIRKQLVEKTAKEVESFFDELANQLGEDCQNVEVLSLSALNLSPEFFAKFKKIFPSLKEYFSSDSKEDVQSLLSILRIAIHVGDAARVTDCVKSIKIAFSFVDGNTLRAAYMDLLSISEFPQMKELQTLAMELLRGFLDKDKVIPFLTSLAADLGEEMAKNVTVLDLSSLNNMSDADLKALSEQFPNVQNLDISKTNCERLTIPENWRHSLEVLDASVSIKLSEFVGLDDCLSLKKLKVRHTALKRAPRGCLNLEEFDAYNCPELEDQTGLDNLRHLTIINVDGSFLMPDDQAPGV